MDVEHPTDPDGAGPTLIPLSALFPEVTEEEGKYLDGETATIMERRARVMAMYRRGRTMRAIKDELGCSLGTVHHDIHTVLEGYKRLARRNADEHLADALQRLSSREADIEAEWEKSKGEKVETYTGRRSKGKSSGKDKSDGGDTDEARVRKTQRYGDPRLAALLMNCWDRRCRLLGLLKAEDMQAIKVPPTKVVGPGVLEAV